MRALRPHVSYSYVADDVFRPYGNKTEAQLNKRLPPLLATLEIMTQPDVIVIACNTASTTALPGLRAACKAPIVGVVPAIKPAAARSKTKTIAVLGTPGTVRRDYVDGLIADFASDCDVILKGSTALVEMAEGKLAGRGVDMHALGSEISPLFDGPRGSKIDEVVLACTHFPLLIDELSQIAPKSVRWMDSGAAIARRVESLLKGAKQAGSGAETAHPDIAFLPDTAFLPNTAFLIGPDPSAPRRRAFASFGFERVVGLCP